MTQILVVLLVVLVVAAAAGPRVSIRYEPQEIQLPQDPRALDAYLAEAEAKISDLNEGTDR